MPKVNSGGVDIDYEILNPEAKGLPVIFISGLGGVRSGWTSQLDDFTRRGPVVLHDHRGTGASAKPLGVYSVPLMASDVIAIMDDAGIERAHLVGGSTGGAIIQVMCIDHPQRVQSAVLSGSWARSDHFFKRQFEMRKRVLHEMGPDALTRFASYALHSPEYFTENFEAIRQKEDEAIRNSPPVDVLSERIDAIMAHDQMDRLGQIAAPTLVVVAMDDFVTPPYYSDQLSAGIPGAELKVFDKGGHFVYIARAGEFNAAVLDFIARHEP